MSKFNRAVAETELVYARQQVFEPERKKFDLTLKALFQERRQPMNWKIFPNKPVRDLLVHLYYENESQNQAHVLITRKGQAVGWIIFNNTTVGPSSPIMAFECKKHLDSDVLLAGWQWLRSMRMISRETYKQGRELLVGLIFSPQIRKRVRRHALTDASTKVISSVMKGPKK